MPMVGTWAPPLTGKADFQPLDHQGSPTPGFRDCEQGKKTLSPQRMSYFNQLWVRVLHQLCQAPRLDGPEPRDRGAS